MLRRHFDRAINEATKQNNLDPYMTQFLFGFTTSFLTFLFIVLLIIAIAGYILQKNIFIKVYNEFEEYRYILPLYYSKSERMKKKKINNESKDEEITIKPQLDFVIPVIKTDHITLNTPASPTLSLDSVSSIKRRTSPFKSQENI